MSAACAEDGRTRGNFRFYFISAPFDAFGEECASYNFRRELVYPWQFFAPDALYAESLDEVLKIWLIFFYDV